MSEQNKHGIEARPDYTPSLIAPPAPETMKIESDETGLGYMIINKSDFDAKTMKKYVEPKGKPADEK